MKSVNVYFVGPEQVEVREEEVREPGPGEVLIKAETSLISTGTELICYARRVEAGSHWDQWVQYPFQPGYSHVGSVIAVGEGVKGLEVGTRVATRRPHHQYVLASAASALPVPEGVSSSDATWFGLASITQNGVRRAEHALGDSVVIIGLGLLGQLVTQYTRILGASEVIAIDLSQARLDMAGSHGATHTLCLPVEEALSEVERLTGGRFADVVYDVTGHAPVFARALGYARTLGKVVLLGDCPTPANQHLSSELIRRGLRVVGAHDVNPPAVSTEHAPWTNRKMQELFFKFVERGQMVVSDLVTRRRSPLDAAETYASLYQDRSTAMGVQFDWTQLA